ncbi:hypothetical protein BCR44DRAFT_1501345 [Catenaria anguillulae PL171]|uniref:Uncharacterized protein n=1 Tax=Catenaria anguillulae PL171 TaxID=765915 RepID=A0A1Y2HH50_9FUNG|nr:hypothetical protein BCR44DRAFT_1501345 [Catenaria anguillulae PL171]
MAPGSAVQSRRPSAILTSVPNSTAASPTLGPIADQVQDDAESGGQGSSGGTPGPNLWASPSMQTLTVDAQETVHNSVKHLLRDSDDGEEAVPGIDIKVGMADLGEDAGASSTSLADKGRPAMAADEARRACRGNGGGRDPGPQHTGDQDGRQHRQTSGEHAGHARGTHHRNRDIRGRGASSGRRDDGGRGDARSRGPDRQNGPDHGAASGSSRSQRSSTNRGGRGRSRATESVN